MHRLKLSLFAATALLASTQLSPASMQPHATLVALVEGRWLVTIDTESRAVTGAAELSGVESLVGIDRRSSNGLLYGVTPDGWLVTLDAATGKATPVVMLDNNLPAGVAAIVDFNPKADKLRLMGSDGTNLRADPESGKVTVDGSLAFEAADMHAGETPAVVAAAYTNARGKPEETAMYDIDSTIVALIQQVSPNDGTLKAVGKLGIDAAQHYAFDIHTDAGGANTGWLVADGTLYRVDLASGAASAEGAIEGLPGAVSDIAAVEPM